MSKSQTWWLLLLLPIHRLGLSWNFHRYALVISSSLRKEKLLLSSSIATDHSQPPHHFKKSSTLLFGQPRPARDPAAAAAASNNDTHRWNNNNNNNGGDDDDDDYTLEYSFNFHRHLIRNCKTGQLVQSFWWKDDALAMFPNVTLLPLKYRVAGDYYYYYLHHHRDCEIVDNTTPSSSLLLITMVAGDVANASLFYPVQFWRDDMEEEQWRARNRLEIYSLLEHCLAWFPSQVEYLFTLCPTLLDIPALLLEERFQFLLSPLPDVETIQRVNTTEDIDWPKLFECYGYGAGMSVAQLSHALQKSPEPFLLRNTLKPLPMTLNHHQQLLLYEIAQHSTTIARDIVPMTMSVLNLWVSSVSYNDILTFSYLHHLGWEWSTFRIVLHALPACHQYQVEGLRMRKTPKSGSKLQAIQYLTLRMQLRPWLVQAMIETHRNLLYYRLLALQRNLDYLQQRLLVRSTHLRKLVLLTPTLLGISPNTMEARIKGFWYDIVGLDVDDLRTLALKVSALLEYNTERNLVSTNIFFREILQLTPQEILRITKINPMVWGRSKEKYYEPLLNTMRDKYNISASEYGSMIARAPELVAYNAKTLEERLDFLCTTEAGFTTKQVRDMVMETPRILKQNSRSSLMPKLIFIRRYYNDTILNPNWLLMPLGKFNESTAALSPKVRNRPIVSIWACNQTIEQVFDNAEIAAAAMNRSRSAIYKAIHKETVIQNRRIAFFVAENSAEEAPICISNETNQEENNTTAAKVSVKPWSTNVLESPTPTPIATTTVEGVHSSHDGRRLVILTDGRAFPPEDLVRGRPRSGGLAIQIHGWDAWKRDAGRLWKNRRTKLLSDHTVLLDYPYLRPSHRRCSYYVCREALRLSSFWIANPTTTRSTVESKAASASLSLTKSAAKLSPVPDACVQEIIIGTESHEVAQTLSNSSLLMTWGSIGQKKEFLNQAGSIANADLLYPLAKTVYDLVCLQNQTVKVSFVHHSTKTLCDGAKLAARMAYYSFKRQQTKEYADSDVWL